MADVEQLKGKYASVLQLISQLGIRLQNLHLQDNKLFLRARAKTRADSERVWNQIKLVNPNHTQDLIADISFETDTTDTTISASKTCM